MLYKRPTLWNRLRRNILITEVFRLTKEFAAGIDAAHGLAHGITPSPDSAARAIRARKNPGSACRSRG
jgi:hypothetical protein